MSKKGLVEAISYYFSIIHVAQRNVFFPELRNSKSYVTVGILRTTRAYKEKKKINLNGTESETYQVSPRRSDTTGKTLARI